MPNCTVDEPPGSCRCCLLLDVAASYAPKTCDLKVSCSLFFTEEGAASLNIEDEKVADFRTSFKVLEGFSLATVSMFRDF